MGTSIGAEEKAVKQEMKRSPRVVLDTNLVVSALVFTRGRVTRLRKAWYDRHCRPLVSKATVEELILVLTYPKFNLSAEEQRELLADYLPYCTTVRMPAKGPETPPCRDPFDVPFLELAIIGRADYLVSGDRDLLTLAGQFSVPIVRVDEFVATLVGQ